MQLYVKRVFIMDDCDALMPNYLRFVKGVVDAHDLSLNISREILQQDRQIQRRAPPAGQEGPRHPQGDVGRSRTAPSGPSSAAVVKEGLLEDPDNTEALLDLVAVASTHDPAELTTLRDYVERMKDGQSEIYYATGESRSHHRELAAPGGVPRQGLRGADPHRPGRRGVGRAGRPVRRQGRCARSPRARSTWRPTRRRRRPRRQRKDYAELLTWLTGALADSVKEVRLSSRLTTSPACVVGDAHDMTPTLEKMYRAMGQEVPQVKRILELNPGHPLVTGLRTAHEQGADSEALTETAELLYGMALLAEGGELADPARFTRILADRLARTL